MLSDKINKLKEHKLLEIFCDLVQIPSPSLSEDKVINWIQEFCLKNNIEYKLDEYKNIFIHVKAKNTQKQPILLSAHMDVVGDFSPVNLELEGDFLQTDKTRTLGADDKAGLACALFLAYELNQSENIDHGGLEIILTRDEEQGMSGIKHVNFKDIKSKYILVLDSDKLGQLLVSGASYTNAILKVKTIYGGHSGIDIHEKKRLNAAKIISELIGDIPQGVYYSDKTGTITSINLGTVIGGNIQNNAAKIVSEKIISDNYLDYFINNSVTNVINTEAQASYSIRSADIEKEKELKELIQIKINNFNDKYDKLANAEIIFSQHLPPFEKTNDNLIKNIHLDICQKLNIIPEVASFHAGAETHIYSQNTNFSGEKFIPFLVGLADILNMHSKDEKVNYKTMLKGYELLKQIFIEFTLKH
jgi:di/tripeptidase